MTGVPTPGAIPGSHTSRSNETWTPTVPLVACARARSVTDGDAQAIDVLHREDEAAGRAHRRLLTLVEVADADEHGVCRQHLGREAADVGERSRRGAEQRRQRHAVHVARKRRLRRVHVAVGVDPDQAERTPVAAREAGRRGHRAGAQAVVAAEHDRDAAVAQDLVRSIVECLAHARDLAEVALPRIARRRRFLGRRVDVAVVVDLVPERGQALADAGDPHRRRSHVDAAAAAAEVERDADDAEPAHVVTSAGGACTRSTRLRRRGRRST